MTAAARAVRPPPMSPAGRVRRCALALVAGGLLAGGCGGGGGDTQSAVTAPGVTSTAAAGQETGAAAPAGAKAITVVRRQRIGARMEEWTLRTPALDDPTHVRVLLPRGYRSDTARRYPVLYLLHGADSDYRSWTRFGDADAITARAPLIVVMPDGGDGRLVHRLVPRRSPASPRWETYHVGELVPWVDATLPHGRGAARARGRRPVDGRLRRAELRRPPPGPVRRRGVLLGRARGRVGADAWGAAPTWRLARAPADLDRCGPGRSRSSSCAPATGGPARSTSRHAAPPGLPARGATRLAGTSAYTRGWHARHPPPLGRLRAGHARLALLAARPARDAPGPRPRPGALLTGPRPRSAASRAERPAAGAGADRESSCAAGEPRPASRPRTRIDVARPWSPDEAAVRREPDAGTGATPACVVSCPAVTPGQSIVTIAEKPRMLRSSTRNRTLPAPLPATPR